MLAVYKKELKSYLTSMIGYVFIAFILLILGIYFTAYNLQYASPDFGYTLNAVTFLFLDLSFSDHYPGSDYEDPFRRKEK